MLDDSGKRILLLQDIAYFSYSRSILNFGTLMIGVPYQKLRQKIDPVFKPDWRIDVWRSPATGLPLRREQTYLLRLYKIYTRESDNLQIIAFYGRDAKDLLRRRYVIQPAGYSQTLKSGYIDDLMKEVVREQMLYGSCVDETGTQDNSRAYPQDEFLVQGDLSLGPYYSSTFAEMNVLDVLKEFQDASIQYHEDEPLYYSRIYFDVVPFAAQGLVIYILDEETGEPILDESGFPLLDESSSEVTAVQGFEFVTWADLRGQDRTGNALVFSVENNNLKEPYYTLTYMDEEDSIIVKGFGRGDSRPVDQVSDTQAINASRWNLCEGFEDASTEPDATYLPDYAYPRLNEGAPQEEISCIFLNVPRSKDTPRSLYGVDWDLGDLLPVFYADKWFSVEVKTVYVAIDERGIETITGQNDIYGSDQA